MKRGATKKVKPVPICAASNNVLEGHLKPVQPVVQRVRTRATMIGIVISIGASSLLLTEQSDRALAVEPVGNEPTTSMVSATTKAASGRSINPVEPEAVQSVPAGESDSAVVPPTHLVQLKAAVTIPAPPVVEHTVQSGQPLRQRSHNYHVDAAASATLSEGIAPYNSLANKRPDLQAGKVLKIRSVDEIVHKLKASKTVETLSGSYKVDPSSFTPLAATAANQQLQMGKPRRVTAQVNALLKAKQRVMVNRLKDSLAQSRSEESNNLSAPVTLSAEPSAVEKAQTTTNQASLPTLVARVSHKQQQAGSLLLEVVILDESAVFDPHKSEQTPDAAVLVPDVPKSAVNEPTVLVTSVSPVHQVRAGDTLSAIARHHGISLSKLINANQLTAPDRLQINQRLEIPRFEYSSAAGQMVAVIKRPTHLDTTASSAAVFSMGTASSNPTISVVPPLSQSPNNSSTSVPTLTITSELQVNPELIAYNQALDSQQGSALVPPKPITVTPSLNVADSSVGGSISDETERVGSPTFDESQVAQSTVAKSDPQFNQYVQNLRTEIQRLRQKYHGQQTVSQVVPMVSETITVAGPIPVAATSTATIPSELINPQLHANRSANEPINPQFHLAQAAEPSQPAINKRPSTKDSSPGPTTAQQPGVKAPIDVDASESLQFIRGSQVSPELPPLGAVDTYLAKPFDTLEEFKGYIWPTKGVVTSSYGWRWGRMHKGIDIAAAIGTPVVASAGGVVIKAGWNSGGYGKLVDIKHADGTLTRYAHNNRLLVQAGQQVEQGQQIAEMGSTGRSTGPHSHFEIHQAGKGAVNPMAFLPR